jgi:light-regulated signal transduction histidine kinase (bacteriophytochrome)
MIARNIMRRKKAERALQKAYEQLERKVEERTEELKAANEELRKEIVERERIEEALRESSEKIKAFAYVICHDLKSPAVGVHGLTTLLRNQYGEVLDEQGRRYCEQIVKAAEQIGALIKQINIYIATKESPLTVETIDFKELFQTLKEEFSAQLSSRRVHWSEPERAVQVLADRLSLTRVFRNLVDNALKYGGAKLTEITMGYEDSGRFHTLSVRDDGVGIESDDSDRIFGLFQRHSSARGVEGTGLGLAIVKEAAERHHGRVWVESTPEQGTTFFVTIAKEPSGWLAEQE